MLPKLLRLLSKVLLQPGLIDLTHPRLRTRIILQIQEGVVLANAMIHRLQRKQYEMHFDRFLLRFND
jgi:hypothetical protein